MAEDCGKMREIANNSGRLRMFARDGERWRKFERRHQTNTAHISKRIENFYSIENFAKGKLDTALIPCCGDK